MFVAGSLSTDQFNQPGDDPTWSRLIGQKSDPVPCLVMTINLGDCSLLTVQNRICVKVICDLSYHTLFSCCNMDSMTTYVNLELLWVIYVAVDLCHLCVE
jgi:hypothetical protein